MVHVYLGECSWPAVMHLVGFGIFGCAKTGSRRIGNRRSYRADFAVHFWRVFRLHSAADLDAELRLILPTEVAHAGYALCVLA